MGIVRETTVYGLSIPFGRSVETTWSKRKGTTTFLVEIQTDKDIKGYGEMIAFFPADLCLTALNRVCEEIKGRNVAHTAVASRRALYGSGWMRTGRMNDLGAAAWAACEMAMLDAQAKESEMCLSDIFGGSLEQRHPVTVNLDVGPVEKMAAEARELIANGYRHLFVKAAKHNTSLAEDLHMLATIADAVGNHVPLHIDVNGAWKLPTAMSALAAIEKNGFNVNCIEQPVMEAAALRSLQRRTKIPIGVNELLTSPQAVVACALAGIGDVFVLDMYEVGGLRNLWYIAQFLADANIATVCRAHGGSSLHYLAALQVLSTCNGAPGPHQYYNRDPSQDILLWDPELLDGTVTLPRRPGIGLDPLPEALAEYANRFESGERYTIYAPKSRSVVPGFPKY